MAEPSPRTQVRTEVTRALAEHASGLDFGSLPADVVERARHCILDWTGVTLAARGEPLVEILRSQALADGGHPHATLVGDGRRVSAPQAALVNGAASHALDYDDVQQTLMGHPTVTVLPAVLALAEEHGASGADLVTALVAGIETECRIGALVGETHYDRGWHGTGTLGTFGAAAGAARLLGLDADRTALALGIAGTQAAGLKSMFGTMCKPLHAGKAATNGLLAARLAGAGFDSRPDVLECAQGFTATQAGDLDAEAALAGLGESFQVRRVLFKYHAACYGTHASIEAARKIRAAHAPDASTIERIVIRVGLRYLKMCAIPRPTTGLEGKFSLAFTVGLALLGEATGAIDTFSEAMVNDPRLTRLYGLTLVDAREDIPKAVAEVDVHLADGVVLRERASVWDPEPDLAVQWSRLREKFTQLATPAIGAAGVAAVVDAVGGIERADSVAALAAACAPSA